MIRFLIKKVLFFTAIFFLIQGTYASTGDTINALHYEIHLLKIDFSNHSLMAYTDLKAVSKMNTSGFTLELKALTADSVFVDGIKSGFVTGNDFLHIHLTQPLNENDTFNVKVYYHGVPFHEDWGGFHWNNNYAFNLGVGFISVPHNLGKAWFPCIDNFTDKATFDVYVNIDNGKKAACGGLLQEVTQSSDSTKTWHWKLSHEVPAYLASVAVGNYNIIDDTYYGIEDTIPIEFFVRPSDSLNVAGSFVNLKTITHFFENKFGPYPFERIGYVSTAKGAMEHATNIAYPYGAINGTTSNEWLFTHELSHMWFGDKITCKKSSEMWINEGWASFCEMYYLEGLGEHEKFKEKMRARNAKVLKSTAIADGGDFALNDVPENAVYGSTSYDKGAVTVNTLRNYLGDSLFSVGVKYALNTLGYKAVSSEEWVNTIGEGAGVNLQSFLDAWVLSPGTPHFSIDSTKTVLQGKGNYKLDIYLSQQHKGEGDVLADDNKLEIGYLKNDFSIVTDTVNFSGRKGHSVKYLDFAPVSVMIDPYEKTCDATVDNFKIFDSPEVYEFKSTLFKLYIDELPDSAFVRVTHHWVQPDSLKHPLGSLRISSRHYWQVEGIFPDGMMSRGKFTFRNNQTLDNDLEITDNDTILILYKPGKDSDWRTIPQHAVGNHSSGFIYVEELKPGYYVTAAVNKEELGINQHPDLHNIDIFPNPAKSKFTVVLKRKDEYRLTIIDTNGRQVFKTVFKGKKKSVNMPFAEKGVFIVNIFSKGRCLCSKKVVVE